MDLVLNNLQRLICHKTQTTNQPTKVPQNKETVLKALNNKETVLLVVKNKETVIIVLKNKKDKMVIKKNSLQNGI